MNNKNNVFQILQSKFDFLHDFFSCKKLPHTMRPLWYLGGIIRNKISCDINTDSNITRTGNIWLEKLPIGKKII
jgi:hypothetical protein